MNLSYCPVCLVPLSLLSLRFSSHRTPPSNVNVAAGRTKELFTAARTQQFQQEENDSWPGALTCFLRGHDRLDSEGFGAG